MQPVVHRGPIGDVHAGGEPARHGHPPDRLRLEPASRCSAAKFGAEAAFHERPQRFAEFGRPLLGGDEQVFIWETIFPYSQMVNRPSQVGRSLGPHPVNQRNKDFARDIRLLTDFDLFFEK
jgi:hypothetical protein